MFSRSMYAALFLLFVAVAARKDSPLDPETVDANNYLDKVLDQVNFLITDDDLDPYQAIDYNFLNVHLTGSLEGLSTLHRVGNAKRTKSPDGKIIAIQATVGLEELTANLNWTIQLGFIPAKGKVSSTADEVLIDIRFRVNVDTKIIMVTKFSVKEVGKVTSQVAASPIPFYDKIASMVTTAVVNMSKNIIAKVVEYNIRDLVEDTLNHYAVEGVPFK